MLKDKQIIQEFFYFFSVLLVTLFLLDLLFNGLIVAYFNFNILFLFWLVSAYLLLCIKIKN